VKWYRCLIHPLFLGFIISVIVVFTIARVFPVQKFEITNRSVLKNDGKIYFCDINNDGNSERVDFYTYKGFFNPSISLVHSDSSVIGFWSFFDTPAKNSSLFFGDYNQNGVKEIFTFTQYKDSVFLYIINPQVDKHYLVERRFIETLPDKQADYQILPIGLLSSNEDSVKEFYFALSVNHPTSHDKIFGYDIAHNYLLESEDINAKIIRPILMNDLNEDGKKELLISTRPKENMLTNISSKLLVFDLQLELFFTPPVLCEIPSELYIDVLENADKKNIIVLNSAFADGKVSHLLYLFDSTGELIAKNSLDWQTTLEALNCDISEKYFTLFSGKQVIEINRKLEVHRKKRLSRNESLQFLAADKSRNNATKEVFFAGDSTLYIFSSDFRKIAKLDIPVLQELNVTVKKENNAPGKISYQSGRSWYLINYVKNMSFLIRYLIYLVLFVVITFIVFLLTKYGHKWWLRRNADKTSYNYPEENLNKEIIQTEEPEGEYHQSSLNSDNKESKDFNLKKLIEQKINNYEIQPEAFFYPHEGWKEINKQLTHKIDELLAYILTTFSAIDKSLLLKLRIFRHKDYLNILFEMPDFQQKDFSSLNDDKIQKRLKALGGHADFDYSEGIGSIANIYIPLAVRSKSNSANQKIKVIIAEDHDVSLFGLVTLFKNKSDIEVVGTAKNGMEVLQILNSKDADIVITDISMPGMDGIELSEHLKTDYPSIKVIVFTMYLENWFVEQLIKHGAKGFVAKNSKINELVNAVYNVYSGKNYYCPQFKTKYGFNSAEKKVNTPKYQLDSLNNYEMKIMDFLADNLSKIKISERLKIKNKTLETFLANIMLKLHAGNEGEIIQIAKKQKYISD